jgi:hypothetical protein
MCVADVESGVTVLMIDEHLSTLGHLAVRGGWGCAAAGAAHTMPARWFKPLAGAKLVWGGRGMIVWEHEGDGCGEGAMTL